MGANEVVRHIQLKTSAIGGATARGNIHLALTKKPSGCGVSIRFDLVTLDLAPFLWLGGQPREKLPSLSELRVTKHTKANAQGVTLERPYSRIVPRALFTLLATISEVVTHLFGSLLYGEDPNNVETTFEGTYVRRRRFRRIPYNPRRDI